MFLKVTLSFQESKKSTTWANDRMGNSQIECELAEILFLFFAWCSLLSSPIAIIMTVIIIIIIIIIYYYYYYYLFSIYRTPSNSMPRTWWQC